MKTQGTNGRFWCDSDLVRPCFIMFHYYLMSVCCGDWFTLFLSTTGQILFVGRISTSLDDRILSRSPQHYRELEKIVSMGAGGGFGLFVDDIGRVWGIGCNASAQLGLCTMKPLVKRPTRVPGLNKIIQVSCGQQHSVCLDQEGFVWHIGRSCEGINVHSQPYKIQGLENIQTVNCGRNHILCLSISGEVWSYGNNSYFLLGNTDISLIALPIPERIEKISSGEFHCLALDILGFVWVFGSNEHNRLGFEIEDTPEQPPLVVPNPERMKLEQIRQVECGPDFSACINQSGNVYVFGNNQWKKLGLHHEAAVQKPTLLPFPVPIQMISLGPRHSIAIDIENQFWGFGANHNYTLALGHNKDCTGIMKLPTELTQQVFVTRNKSARKVVS
uniref:RCC1-like domain-containing protein n=1 Tax=Vannella robusta TaxID=1487602 RepID=A0A7S4IAW0_9EUKA|mmetsp:Transcript_22882/g.29192  ORF Transcript_22882/g.29192 Transcript_22882/m.29192 type:complete len:388 (+) Transcript_22882:248-1411(+)